MKRPAVVATFALLLAVAIGAVSPASARATVTVGSDLANAPATPGSCSPRCTRVLISPPSGKGASPISGTIVRWRFRTSAGSGGAALNPRVIRPLGAVPDDKENYLGAGTGSGLTLAGTAGVQEFAVRMAMRKGDLLGFDQFPSSTAVIFRAATSGWAEFGSACGSGLDDGEMCAAGTRTDYELMMNADVVGEPSSSAATPPCQESGDVNVTVHTDRGSPGNPGTTARAAHYRIDGGPEQAVLTTGDPGLATLSLPRGRHTLEYWGEDQIQQESGHHLAGITIGGCTPAALAAPTALAAVSGLALSDTTFAAEGSGPPARNARKKKPARGTKVSFRLTKAATVRFTVTRRAKGRKVKKGKKTVCARPTKKNRKRKRCTRVVTLKGSFSRTAVAGKNSFRFTGRLDGRKLKPGKYRLVARPSAGGKTGKPTSTGFRIVH